MARGIIKERLTRKKLLVLLTSFIVAANMGVAAYLYFTKDMTDWQKNQPLDVLDGRGLTRAKAYADSGIVAGISFAVCAGGILLVDKIRRNKK